MQSVRRGGTSNSIHYPIIVDVWPYFWSHYNDIIWHRCHVDNFPWGSLVPIPICWIRKWLILKELRVTFTILARSPRQKVKWKECEAWGWETPSRRESNRIILHVACFVVFEGLPVQSEASLCKCCHNCGWKCFRDSYLRLSKYCSWFQAAYRDSGPGEGLFAVCAHGTCCVKWPR